MIVRPTDPVTKLIGKVFLDDIEMTPYGVLAASPDEGWLEVTRSPQGAPLSFTFGPNASARLVGHVVFEVTTRVPSDLAVLALEARYHGLSAFLLLPELEEVRLVA